MWPGAASARDFCASLLAVGLDVLVGLSGVVLPTAMMVGTAEGAAVGLSVGSGVGSGVGCAEGCVVG